jgi:hypothetical protein
MDHHDRVWRFVVGVGDGVLCLCALSMHWMVPALEAVMPALDVLAHGAADFMSIGGGVLIGAKLYRAAWPRRSSCRGDRQ